MLEPKTVGLQSSFGVLIEVHKTAQLAFVLVEPVRCASAESHPERLRVRERVAVDVARWRSRDGSLALVYLNRRDV